MRQSSRRPTIAVVFTVVLVTLVTATLAAGARSRADHGPHLLEVPKDPEALAEVERKDPRVVASYRDFLLVEADGEDVGDLASAGARPRDDMSRVTLGARSVDPVTDRKPLLHKQGEVVSGTRLAVVQFIGPIKDAWFARLRKTGVRVVSYMAQNAYLVEGTRAALSKLGALPGTDPAARAVIPYLRGDKLNPSVDRIKDGRIAVAVQTVSGKNGSSDRNVVTGLGGRLRKSATVGGVTTQWLKVDRSELNHLASLPTTISVQPYSPPQLLDERAGQIVAANLTGSAPSGPGYLSWLTGKGFGSSTLGFAVDITDGGLDTGSSSPDHQDFYEQGSNANPSRVSYVNDLTADADGVDCSGHGTNVASIAAGYNSVADGTHEDAQGFNYGLGVAPIAGIGASKVFKCTGEFDLSTTFAGLTAAAYAGGARVSNNSWGSKQFGGYNADSQAYDALVRDAQPLVAGNQELVEVFSAGNSGVLGIGSIGAPGTAKNVITVGASENVRDGGTDGCGVTDAQADNAGDVVGFSSRGPTSDGRLKPDLVAPGTHVAGASPQGAAFQGNPTPSGVCDKQFPSGNAFYSRVSGTSQAAPEITGAAAMVMEWWRVANGVLPSPAMVKALLTNTATDLAGGNDGAGGTLENVPEYFQGWGRANLAAVLSGTAREYRDQQPADTFNASGESYTNTYAVADPGQPVKVTLAWTDPPGPTNGDTFVNDLDLIVDQGGSSYRGNAFANGWSVAGGAPDPRNNLESVFLPAGTSGAFSAKVLASNIAGDGVPGSGDATDQDFALVVSNATTTNAPVLAHDSAVVSDASGEGSLWPGESFTLAETLRNSGDSAASNVSGVLSSVQPGVGVTQPAASFANLSSGATATGSSPFAATLSGNFTCGDEVGLNLGVSSDQGNFNVPISVPTGGTGPAQTVASADVPKSIPDNSSAGTTSQVEVAESGIVKDVNVAISHISHSAVGDLRIELIAPDGTSVLLASHPGGVSNTGNDLIGTVFDDEAQTNITNGSAPYTGSFRPQGDRLSRLDGKQQKGIWKLRVSDTGAGDSGTLESWGTVVSPAQCATAAPAAPTPTLQPDRTKPKLSISRQVLHMTPRGRVPIRVRCTKHELVCKVRLDLLLRKKVHGVRRRLARKRFEVRGGRSRKVNLHLNRKARRLVRRRRSVAVKARAVVRDPAGNRKIAKRKLRLRARRRSR